MSKQETGRGGAAAAAADLARAGLTDAGSAVDPERLSAATEIFRAADKYLRGTRAYDKDHATLTTFLDDLEAKTKAYVRRYEELRVTLQPTTVALEGECIYTAERVDTNIWFALFGDGIRQLTFEEHVTREELVKFFAVLDRITNAPDGENQEEDAVTMMWEAELDGIAFVAVDRMMEGREDVESVDLTRIKTLIDLSMMKDLRGAALTGQAYAAGEVTKRMHNISLSSADFTFLKAENLAALDEMPLSQKEVLGKLFDVGDQERARFEDQVASDPMLIERYLDAVLAAIASVIDPTDAVTLMVRLQQFLGAIVADSRFRRAVDLFRKVNETVLIRSAQDLAPELANALGLPLVTEAMVDHVMTTVAGGPDSAVLKQIFELLAAMPESGVGRVVETLSAIPDRGLRRRLCDSIAHFGNVVLEPATNVLPDASEDIAFDLLHLIRQVASRDALEVLEAAINHPNSHVRAKALALYFELAPLAEAYRRGRLALSDSDAVLRRVATDYVSKARPPGAAEWIKARIDDERFADLEFSEKRRLFIAYAAVGDQQVAPWFVDRLTQRNMLKKTSIDHERAAAAWALGQLRFGDARKQLEKLAGGRLVRGFVKEACVEALQMLDRPAAAEKPAGVEAQPTPTTEATKEPALDLGIPSPGVTIAGTAAPRPGPGATPTATPAAAPPAQAPGSTVRAPAAPPVITGRAPVVAFKKRPNSSRPAPATEPSPAPPVATPPADLDLGGDAPFQLDTGDAPLDLPGDRTAQTSGAPTFQADAPPTFQADAPPTFQQTAPPTVPSDTFSLEPSEPLTLQSSAPLPAQTSDTLTLQPSEPLTLQPSEPLTLQPPDPQLPPPRGEGRGGGAPSPTPVEPEPEPAPTKADADLEALLRGYLDE